MSKNKYIKCRFPCVTYSCMVSVCVYKHISMNGGNKVCAKNILYQQTQTQAALISQKNVHKFYLLYQAHTSDISHLFWLFFPFPLSFISFAQFFCVFYMKWNLLKECGSHIKKRTKKINNEEEWYQWKLLSVSVVLLLRMNCGGGRWNLILPRVDFLLVFLREDWYDWGKLI